MNPIIGLLLTVLAFWSLFTTCKAIYLILTKDFQGDKTTWILTVMIGLIGPILWVTKGRKLISKTKE